MSNEVSIRITSQDLSGPGFDSAQARSKKFAAAVDGGPGSAGAAMETAARKATGLGASLRRVGEVAAGVLAAEALQAAARRALALVKDTVEAATSLGESVNAVSRIFEASAQDILDWGKSNANAFGLSQRAFNQMATPLGAMLKNQGLAMDEVSAHTIKLTERAADMASVFNTDVTDALTAIQAGLRGEADPLERYGVSLNAVAVEARALADTGKATAASLTAQEKALARLEILYDQTASTAGDFQATSTGLANATRIMNAEFEEAQAKIGATFLPVMAMAATVAANLADSISQLPTPVIATVAAVGALGAGLLIAAPRIVATRKALDDMAASSSRAERVTGRVAVVAAKGAGAFAALQVAGALVGTMLSRNLNPQVEAATAGLDKWTEKTELAGEAARLFGEHGDELSGSLEKVIRPGFGSDFAKNMDKVAEAVTGGAYSLDEARERVNAFDAALADLVKSGKAAQAARLVEMMGEKADISIEDLKKALPEYAAAMETGAKQTTKVAKAAEAASQNLDELHDSFRDLIEQAFSVEEAEDGIADAVADLTEKVKQQRDAHEKGAGALSGNTQAARDNRAAVRDLVEQYAELAFTYEENGQSTEGLRRKLEDQLVQMGFNRREAEKYTKQLDGVSQALREIPKSVTITLKTDAQKALEKIHETERELRALTREEYIVHVGAAAPGHDQHGGHAAGGITGAGWPGAAAGGARGGLTMVGERGRELVRLPFGSSVYSNADTERMLGRGGGSGGGFEMILSTRGNDRLLDVIVRELSYDVRTRGGGNVQEYLGGG